MSPAHPLKTCFGELVAFPQSTKKNPMKTNLAQIHALKTKLAAMRDDLYNMVFSEVDQAVVVLHQAKIRALKAKVTRMENAR